MSDPRPESSKFPGASGPPRGISRTEVRAGRRGGFRGHDLVLTLILTALLTLAGWQVVHSEALIEALYEHRHPLIYRWMSSANLEVHA